MRIVVVILLLLFGLQLNADNINYDTTHIEIRKPSIEKLKKYQQDSDYAYIESPPTDNSFFQYASYYIRKFFIAFFSNEGVMPYIRYLIIALFLAFVIYQLAKNQINGLFSFKTQSANIEISDLNEDINTKNLDELIQEEIENRNFRKAVRLYYIKALKLLNTKELINWDQNKTNRDYYYDLAGSGIEIKYQQLTWVYENIWYGNFPVGNEYFYKTDDQFNKFFKVVEGYEKN